MAVALSIAQVVISMMLIILVIIQARTPGMSNQDSTVQYTRRGLERTLHHVTIGLAVVFLIVALVNSLPIFI